jgi:hypothetical protein
MTMQATVPPAPPPLIMQQATEVRQPWCDTDPCGVLNGERVILVGWLVSGTPEMLKQVAAAFGSRWQVTSPWKAGASYTLRIYTSGKTFKEAVDVSERLHSAEFGGTSIKALTLPIEETAR